MGRNFESIGNWGETVTPESLFTESYTGGPLNGLSAANVYDSLFSRTTNGVKSGSITKASQSEVKLLYVKLNIQMPCPPRGTVPV